MIAALPSQRSTAGPFRRSPAHDLLLVVLLALEVVAVAVATRSVSYDDAYITYTYATNLAEGHGLTWNGRPIVGTTSPFYATTLGVLQRLVPVGAPAWGTALYWISIFGVGTALLLWAAEPETRFPRALAAFLLPLSRLVVATPGSEFGLATAALALGLLALERGRPYAAGALFGLSVCTRPDLSAVVGAVALVNWIQAGGAGRRLVRALATTTAVGLAWLSLLQAMTGEFLPTTLAVKRAQGASALPAWSASAGWYAPRAAFDALVGAPLDPIRIALWSTLILVAAAALRSPRRRNSPESLLAVGALAHVALLAILRVPMSGRYLLPASLALLLCCTQGFAALPLGGRRRRGVLVALAAALVLCSLPRAALRGRGLVSDSSEAEVHKLHAYRQVAHFVAGYPPDRTVAFWEVGVLGFETRRPVLDLLGLVSNVPLDAVRWVRLEQARRLLRPDLIPIPLVAPRLTASAVGDIGRFLLEHELDHLEIETQPAIAVYRRREVRGRGEVLTDLLADRPAGTAVELVVDRRFVALALTLDSGASLRVPIAGREEVCWVEPAEPSSTEGARTYGALADGSAPFSRSNGDGRTELACARSASTDADGIALSCPTAGDVTCSLPLLHRRAMVGLAHRAPTVEGAHGDRGGPLR